MAVFLTFLGLLHKVSVEIFVCLTEGEDYIERDTDKKQKENLDRHVDFPWTDIPFYKILQN